MSRDLFAEHLRAAVAFAAAALEAENPVLALGYLYLASGHLRTAQQNLVIEAEQRVEESRA